MSFGIQSPESGEQPTRRPENRPEQDRDPWSLLVAVVSGIPIRLHFTFLLLIIWIAVTGIGRGGAGSVLFVLGLFFCVVLHELGHALTAQRFGYGVRDIVLYPIGGVAAIEDLPRARHELWIALAGPAVNVLIASLIALYLSFQPGGLAGQLQFGQQNGRITGEPIVLIMLMNISLALFNMIPAFPMDGGRVLRAILSLWIPREKATRIAAFIGQTVAIFLGIYALQLRPINFGLMVIALFVFFAAGQEAKSDEVRETAIDALVGEAMVRDFQTLGVGDNLRRATEVLLATSQQDFPVVLGDEVQGVLSRSSLLRGLAQDGEAAYVSGVMERDVVFATPDEPLQDYMTRADGVQRAPILVRDAAGKLVGMLTLDNLMEFLTIRQVLRSHVDGSRA